MVTVMCSAILLNINHRGAFPVTQSASPHPLVPALALQCTAHMFFLRYITGLNMSACEARCLASNKCLATVRTPKAVMSH